MQCNVHVISPGRCPWRRLFPAIDLRKTWPSVFDKFWENKKHELGWLSVHRSVRTAVELYDWHVI